MEKIKTIWGSSFRSKIIFSFIIIVLVNLIVIGVIVNLQVSRTIKNDATQLSLLVLEQANLNLTGYLKEYEKFLLTLGTSQELQAWANFSSGDERAQSIVPYSAIVKDFVSPFVNNHPELLSIQFYHAPSSNHMVYSNGYGYKPGYAIEEEKWIFDLSPINKITFHIDINKKYVDNSLKTLDISYISLVKSFNYKGSVYVKLDIEPVLMQNILNHLNLGNGAVGFIVDNNGTIVAHPNQALILTPIADNINKGLQESPYGYYVDQKSGDLLIFKPIPGTEWKSVFAIPYEEIMGSIYTTRNMVIGTAIVCLLVSILIIVVMSSSLTSRIMKLKRALYHTGQGRISVMLPVEGRDEISALSHSYNNMLTDLKYSIERLSKAQFAEQQAVLLSLQSQIDSHFLYNTLEIINSMASRIQHDDIENITVSLAQMFRYTANYKFTSVTLQDEMNHLLNYLRIIEIRYLERFSYQLKADENCMDAKCMKVILQPLAENAVKHGLNGDVDSLHIAITVQRYDEHTVEFLVSDNGIGFSEQRLQELREQLSQHDSDTPSPHSDRIGLLNIQHRLNLHYPTQMAKLQIGNNSVRGAYVQILFPYQSSWKEGRKDALS